VSQQGVGQEPWDVLHSIWTRHGTEDFLGSDWTKGYGKKRVAPFRAI